MDQSLPLAYDQEMAKTKLQWWKVRSVCVHAFQQASGVGFTDKALIAVIYAPVLGIDFGRGGIGSRARLNCKNEMEVM